MIQQLPSFKSTSWKKFLFFTYAFTLSFFGYSKDIYVNDASTTGDVWCSVSGSSGGTGTKALPYSTLKTALTNAVSGDVIYVDAGNYTEKYLLAKSGVTIVGAGAYKTTFIGSGISGIWFMKIDGVSNFSISNITSSKYLNNDGSAGQIFTINNSSNIKINNVILAKNDGSNGDAGIYIGTGSSNISLDSISGSCQNTSSSGTAIVVSGKDISVFIKNSLFSGNDNSAQGSNGSAVRLKADLGSTPNVVVNIENSIFSKNTAKAGGAIYIEGGSVTINKCKFLGNKTTNTSGSNGGGAIWVCKTNSLCTISNSEFKDNVTVSDGGAIQVYTGAGISGAADVKIENCLFENNTANNGKDIHTRMNASRPFNVTVNNCIFKSTGTNIVSGPAVFGPCQDGILKISNSSSPSVLGLNAFSDPGCKSTINIDNLPSGYTDPGITFPTYQGCPNAAICNPVIPGSSPTVFCPATSVSLTATGPAGSNFSWYDVATGGTALGSSTASSTGFNVQNITGTKTFYVVSDLDNCQTRVPITINCTACPKLSYDGALCNAGSVSPTITPSTSASNYTCTSANKANLIINSTTGVIDLASSKPGTYDIKCVITAGTCEPVTSLTINPKPIIADMTNSTCSGELVDDAPNLIAPNSIPTGTTYTWTVTPPAGITGSSSVNTPQTAIVQNLTNTTNTSINVDYIITASSGSAPIVCSSNFKYTVTVKPKPVAPTLGTPVESTCNTDGSVLISGLPVVSSPLQWTLKSNSKYNFTTSGNTATYNYTALKPNSKIRFIVELDGCYSDSTTELTVANAPSKPYLEGPSSVCLNSEITLKAWTDNTKTTKSTPSTTSPWYLKDAGDADTVSLTTGTDPSITSNIVKGLKSASSTKSAEVVLIYKDINGCISDYFISVNSIPTLTYMNVGSGVCIGSQMELKASIPGGVWTCLSPQIADLSSNYLYPKSGVTGLNMVELKYQLDQKNCNASIIEYVKIYPVPKITGNSTSICVGDTTSFKDIANRDPLNEKTIWSLTNNTVATIDNNGLLKAIKDGSSEVLGKNVFGCTSQSYVKIRPTALFDDTTIYFCSGVEKSFIPLFKNSSKQLNPTLKWSVVTTNSVDGENEMQTLVPAFKQILTNKSGNDQQVNYMLTSSVGTGSDACLINRNLIVMVSSALDIVGPSNIDLGNQVQYTSLNKSDKTLKWSTSNPQVIMVDNTGMVASKGMGSAILSVSNAFGCSAEMNVNVTQNQKIKGLNYVCEGSQITLSGFGTPKTVDPWTSSNTSILTINAVGQVTGLKAGKSQVTYYSDQGAKDTLTIVVKATPMVNTITDYSICPGYFVDSIKFNGTPGASFEWKNTNVTSGILPSGLNRIYPFKAINDGTSPINSQISVTPRLGECFGTTKTFNIIVRFNPKLVLNQVDTLVCLGGNVNFKTEITPVLTSPTYIWYVNGAKVGANSSIYWSNTLKSNDKIMVNLSGKDFCPTSANLIVRMDSLRLSMQLPSMLYVKAPAFNLVGYPIGGTFSGKGITTNKLDPSVVGVGTKLVTYSFKNTNNCSGQITQKVLVYDTLLNNCHVTTYDTVKVTVSDTVSILKVKFKLTTGIKANQETTMRVFPNPTSDILRIEADEKAMAGYAYKIIDAAGKVVYNQLVKAAVTEIPLKTLGAVGAYFLEVLDENFKIVVSKKIILE